MLPSTSRGGRIELIFENEIANILGNTVKTELKLYTRLYFNDMYSKVDRFLTKCNVRHYFTYNSVRMDFRCILVPLAALSVQY